MLKTAEIFAALALRQFCQAQHLSVAEQRSGLKLTQESQVLMLRICEYKMPRLRQRGAKLWGESNANLTIKLAITQTLTCRKTQQQAYMTVTKG